MRDNLDRMQTKSNYRNYIRFIIVSFLLTILLQILARLFSPFAEWYANTIYPIIVNTVGRVVSVVPFSVIEILIYLGILYFLFLVIRGVKRLFTRPKSNMNYRLSLLCFLSLLSGLSLIFTLTIGINYHRTTFSEKSGMLIRQSTKEELVDLTKSLINRSIAISQQVTTDEQGRTVIDVDLNETAREAMKKVGSKYPSLNGYYPNPKPILASKLMSYTRIVGVYSPFTVEANYDNHVPDYDIPTTILHELSHLKGFMREDEANFIAYLASMESDSAVFQYSGIVSAIVHSMNALYDAGGIDEYWALYDMLPEQVKRDLESSNEYWAQFASPVAEVVEVVNNTYLKANNQTDGTRSYGRVVDLLLAEYRAQNGIE